MKPHVRKNHHSQSFCTTCVSHTCSMVLQPLLFTRSPGALWLNLWSRAGQVGVGAREGRRVACQPALGHAGVTNKSSPVSFPKLFSPLPLPLLTINWHVTPGTRHISSFLCYTIQYERHLWDHKDVETSNINNVTNIYICLFHIYTHIYIWILQNDNLIVGELVNKMKCVQAVGTAGLWDWEKKP